jgi:hypothetical protein
MKRVFAAALALAATCSSAFAQGNTVYAINNRGAMDLIKFPISTPAYNLVGPTGSLAFAMDFNGDGSILYAITNPGQTLVTVNQATGALTTIGTISGAGAAETNWGGLSFDSTTGTMYALAPVAAGVNNLYKVNLTNAATTLVAPITGTPAGALYIDIAIDSTGKLYGHDIVADALASIDKNTGVATLIGPTGMAANFAQGMDFDPATNILYATIYTGGGTGGFGKLSTTTGAFTLITNTQPWTVAGPEMEMAVKGAAVTCYPDCNGDGVLGLADFGCFQTKFALNDPYADCNGDGVLGLADFGCFQTKFALGCP